VQSFNSIAKNNGAATQSSRPHYVPVGSEERVFKAAYRQRLSILLKGPTGCGKTRFVEAMAHDLGRPLITVACHDDLTTADLVGRFLLEARQDTTVVLHPLADHRRQLQIERLGITLNAPREFCLVVSYNPGYQSILKDLKDSTRQRMAAIEFGFPAPEAEQKIVAHEAGLANDKAAELVRLGQAIRRLDTAGLREVASTRTLIAAGRLVAEGLSMREAARAAIAQPLTDDATVTRGLLEMIDVYLPDQRA
jgi:nitric oxide reductase NorQ protein